MAASFHFVSSSRTHTHHKTKTKNREKLVAGGKAPVLTARLMEKRLKEWAKGGDSLMWGDFQRAVVAEPAKAEA